MWARILILAMIIMAHSAHAATWEDLFNAKSKDVEARVELKKSSFRQRLVRGEKNRFGTSPYVLPGERAKQPGKE